MTWKPFELYSIVRLLNAKKCRRMFDKNGQIIEENVRLREESLRQRAEEEHRTRQEIEDEDNRHSE